MRLITGHIIILLPIQRITKKRGPGGGLKARQKEFGDFAFLSFSSPPHPKLVIELESFPNRGFTLGDDEGNNV